VCVCVLVEVLLCFFSVLFGPVLLAGYQKNLLTMRTTKIPMFLLGNLKIIEVAVLKVQQLVNNK